ncbi:coiled-coil domain-containing protein 93 isoform X1 [Camellia sinensis]|uniref:coiled-coil domain-containing protein 93 isoform X1 n=1 Tax=Camellia sinensis TaxID=4442 RepID=UPI0010361FF6|nr:coiled-coil domain-containing protein 93 isoform X1 [Camellia sinensis]
MVTCTENSIEEEEHAFVQLQEELKNVGSSIDTLNTNLEQLNQRKANCLNKMQHLQERISREGTTDVVQRLSSLSQSLKALEMQESEHKSNCNAKYSKLQAEVNELENIICGNDDANLSHGINHSLYNSLERLNSAKRELAVKLREIVLLKRQLDDVPSQEELIQYEHRFSELYVHIQEKLRQTRELYATFNAMLEIKDLMLKETSLLNSISSQFQDAITSTAGRTKLVDSMEGISKGTQQKLEKVRLTLEAERNVRDAVKQRYAAAIVEQRSCYSLLKAFQEECTKNERLRSLSSEILP